MDEAENVCCATRSAPESGALHCQSDTCMQRRPSNAKPDCEEKRDPDRRSSVIQQKENELDPDTQLEKRAFAAMRQMDCRYGLPAEDGVTGSSITRRWRRCKLGRGGFVALTWPLACQSHGRSQREAAAVALLAASVVSYRSLAAFKAAPRFW